MSDSKYTPGPWPVSKNQAGVFGRKQGNGLEPIGFVYIPSFHDRSAVGQRAMANCHLIAAAPDLLEALEEWIEDPFTNQVKARAAIAKATGSEK